MKAKPLLWRLQLPSHPLEIRNTDSFWEKVKPMATEHAMWKSQSFLESESSPDIMKKGHRLGLTQPCKGHMHALSTVLSRCVLTSLDVHVGCTRAWNVCLSRPQPWLERRADFAEDLNFPCSMHGSDINQCYLSMQLGALTKNIKSKVVHVFGIRKFLPPLMEWTCTYNSSFNIVLTSMQQNIAKSQSITFYNTVLICRTESNIFNTSQANNLERHSSRLKHWGSLGCAARSNSDLVVPCPRPWKLAMWDDGLIILASYFCPKRFWASH